MRNVGLVLLAAVLLVGAGLWALADSILATNEKPSLVEQPMQVVDPIELPPPSTPLIGSPNSGDVITSPGDDQLNHYTGW